MKDIKEIIMLRFKGYTLRDIAAKLGKSLGAISAMNKKLMPKITELRKNELAVYCKRLDAIRNKRVAFLDSLLDRFQEILEKDNLDLDSLNRIKIYLTISDKLSAFNAEGLKMRMDAITMDDASVEQLNNGDASIDKSKTNFTNIEQK